MVQTISRKALQSCADQLASPFQKLFQLSLNSGIVPDLWKKSLNVPMPKNSRPKENNDLRPVALTSVNMKCIERKIQKQIMVSHSN
jgi:hypothetical protein